MMLDQGLSMKERRQDHGDTFSLGRTKADPISDIKAMPRNAGFYLSYITGLNKMTILER